MYQNLTIIAFLVLIYSLLAGRIEKTWLSGPIIFVVLGVIAGPLGINILNFNIQKETYKTLAELALALVLFTDASKTNLRVLEHNIAIPLRLLLLGLPLTIFLGWVMGYLVFNDFLWIEAALLAVILAPTDAALGKPVVSSQKVQSKIREGLNVESGLNDGVCVPVLFLLVAIFAAQSVDKISLSFGLVLFAREIGIGLLVGLVVTFICEKLIGLCFKRSWILDSWKPMIIIAMAVCCFSLAQVLNGSGFISCFSGGILYGAINKTHKIDLIKAAEGTGNTLGLIVWIIFGSLVVSEFFHEFTWPIIIYAILSLTLIRILPVFISLIGVDLNLSEKLFTGWFGPRGLASIVFVIMTIDLDLPNLHTLVLTVICTVLLSILLHGFTANPIIKRTFHAK